MRLIDADELKKALAEMWYENNIRITGLSVAELIDHAPTIEPSGDLISRKIIIGAIEKCGEEKIYPQALIEVIQALPSADRPIEHDGCDGCQHEHKAETEYPCTECKQNYRDKYRRKENTSSADRPKGEWIIHGEPPMYVIECSQCGQKYFNHALQEKANFCSNCGADMRGE